MKIFKNMDSIHGGMIKIIMQNTYTMLITMFVHLHVREAWMGICYHENSRSRFRSFVCLFHKCLLRTYYGPHTWPCSKHL